MPCYSNHYESNATLIMLYAKVKKIVDNGRKHIGSNPD